MSTKSPEEFALRDSVVCECREFALPIEIGQMSGNPEFLPMDGGAASCVEY